MENFLDNIYKYNTRKARWLMYMWFLKGSTSIIHKEVKFWLLYHFIPLLTLPLILNVAANLQHPFVNPMQGENLHEHPSYLYSNLERDHLHQPYRKIYVQFSTYPHSFQICWWITTTINVAKCIWIANQEILSLPKTMCIASV